MEVALPKRMRALAKDRRGYPVPWIILRDLDGKPHFTINDSGKVYRCLKENRCPVCGYRLEKPLWFVGGPRSAFDPRGAYLDTALHYECMTYALQVCPYLAAPNYSGRVDVGTLDMEKVPNEFTLFIDHTMIPERPKVFVAVASMSQTFDLTDAPPHYIRPTRPYTSVEYWLHGKRIEEEAARIILGDLLL